MSDILGQQLEALRARALNRRLREISGPQGPIVLREGKRLINFSSNDYLGLANDVRLREAAAQAMAEFGVGAGASRLISGTQTPHIQLEAALAKWKRTEATLCFNSGYAAAVGAIPALVEKNDVVNLDKLCHASLIHLRPENHDRVANQSGALFHFLDRAGSGARCRCACSHRFCFVRSWESTPGAIMAKHGRLGEKSPSANG